MVEKARTEKDWWDKCESSAKILAGVCAAIGALAIPWFINKYTEENRKSQVYVQMMTEREKSDTSIRENMFKTLLAGYLQTLKEDVTKEDLASFRKRIVFLELLAVNFHEFINAKPLFEEVYEKLVKYRSLVKDVPTRNAWMELEKKITGISRDLVATQVMSLSNIGDSNIFSMRKDEIACIRFYDKAGLDELRRRDGVTRFEYFEPRDCLPDRKNEAEGKAGTSIPTKKNENGQRPLATKGYRQEQSIELRVKELRDASVVLEVTFYADFFDRNIFVGSKAGKGISMNVSYFDLPYMDNIKLADGTRFALVLKGIYKAGKESAEADIEAIRFRSDFMSLRDRPLFEEMLKKLR